MVFYLENVSHELPAIVVDPSSNCTLQDMK
jgi:hypothetical protein